jgi:hypothetical protein
MVRSYWKGTLVAVLGWSSLAWGQPPLLPSTVSTNHSEPVQAVPVEPIPPLPVDGQQVIAPVPAGNEPAVAPVPVSSNERIITVQEPGRPPQQCRILREWCMSGGNVAMEVQAIDTGEKMTIVDVGSVGTVPDAYPTIRNQGRVSRIFRWGQDRMPPPGTPMPPLADDRSGAVAGTMGQPGRPQRGLGQYRDPVTGSFDNQKYLADLRSRYGSDAQAPAAAGGSVPPGTAVASKPAVPPRPSLLGSFFGDRQVVKDVPGTRDDSKGPAVATRPDDAGKTSETKLITKLLDRIDPNAKVIASSNDKGATADKKSDTTVKKDDVKGTVADGKTTPLWKKGENVVNKTDSTVVKKTDGPSEDHQDKPFWRRWFSTPAEETALGFDREKYLAELRNKYSTSSKGEATVVKQPVNVKDQTVKKETLKTVVSSTPPRIEVKPKVDVLPTLEVKAKPEVKPPTATLPRPVVPPPPPPAVAKAPVKPPVEPAQPTDWRRSWSETSVAKTEEKPTPVLKIEVAQKKEAELPRANPLRPDPLEQPERYSKRPEIKPASVQPSPLMTGIVDSKPAVAQASSVPAEQPAKAPVDVPGKASTARVPLGSRSVMAAYGDLQPGQVVYLPVPMVTVPPTAHTVQPPQVAQNLPPQVNEAMVNAFTPEMAPPDGIMPVSHQGPAAGNAFTSPQQMRMPMDPMPMGHPMAMGYSMPMGHPMMPMGHPMMPPMMPGHPMVPPAAMAGAMPMPSYPAGPGMMQGPGTMTVGYWAPAAPIQPYVQPRSTDPQTAQQLIQTLRDALYPSQREWAVETLATMDWRTHPQIFDALLTAAREDPAATVRSCCVRCLSAMNVSPSILAMTLQSLKNDRDPRVRHEVEQALSKLPQKQTGSDVVPAGGSK